MDKYKVTTAKELFGLNFPKQPNLWEPFLPKVGLAGIAGGSDVGKSTFLRQLAIAIISDQKSFLGHSIDTAKREVLYISTEDGKQALKNALKKQLPEGEQDKQYLDRLMFLTGDAEGDPIEIVDNIASKHSLALVVVDAWADTYTGSINETNKVRANLNLYSSIAEKHNLLVLILHHTGKRAENLEPDKNNLLGSQGIEGKLRVLLELRVDRIEPHVRYLSVLKGNYLPASLKAKALKLEFGTNLNFTYTGKTVDLKDIVVKANLKFGSDTELKKRAVEMYKAGKTLREIEVELAKLYTTAPKKSTIGNWITEYKATKPILPKADKAKEVEGEGSKLDNEEKPQQSVDDGKSEEDNLNQPPDATSADTSHGDTEVTEE
jgi:hypothetical protein